MPNPKINPVILVSPVENGYVAYDPVLDRLHHLNPAAALIAELSDGSRSIENICALICPLVAEMQPEDASNWIVKSIDAGLLVWDDSSSAQASELPAVAPLSLPNGSKPPEKCKPPISAENERLSWNRITGMHGMNSAKLLNA